MPRSHRIYPEHRLVVTRAWGIVTDDDVMDGLPQIGNDPAFRPDFRQLADLRGVEGVRASAESVRAAAQLGAFAPDTRRAFVVAADLVYGLARMFETYAELSGQTIEVFRDLPAALAWLGLPRDARLDLDGD